MIQYIIECIGFQLLFLIIYDVFLRRETFFQWNRVYLIGTFLASLVLPFIKIDFFKTTIATSLVEYPIYFQGILLDELVLKGENNTTYILTLEQAILFSGMFVALMFFLYKIYQVHQLKNKGTVRYLTDFTRVIIKNSEIAFSFFKSVFIGDKIMTQNYKAIIEHELVHIRQGHSYDLIFFKSSLIKKRIVMLQKSKSRKALALKYAIVVPAFLAILFYTSCESDSKVLDEEATIPLITEENKIIIEFKDLNNLTPEEQIKKNRFMNDFKDLEKNTTYVFIDSKGTSIELKVGDANVESMNIKKNLNEKSIEVFEQEEHSDQGVRADAGQIDVPFSVVENAPVFPGCEDAADKRACFQEKMFAHISKNFRYPENAQKNGVQGKVYVNFVINEDGLISKARMRGPDKSLEEEAARIIGKLPKMTPGLQRGRAVNVPFTIPITFKLE